MTSLRDRILKALTGAAPQEDRSVTEPERLKVEATWIPSRPPRQRLDYRAARLPVGHSLLTQGPRLDVVGESHYRAVIETYLGRRPEGHEASVDAVLVAEPDNPVDPDAIAVRIAGQTWGYLPRLAAKRYKPVMEWAAASGFVPVARGEVTGGWEQPDGSWADFGLALSVALPHALLGHEPPTGSVPSRQHPWVGYLIAFTGDSRYTLDDMKLDRLGSEALARQAGIDVHARVTKKVRLLVDCDDDTTSGNQRRAVEYGIPVIREGDFWAALGLPIEPIEEKEMRGNLHGP